MFSFSGPVAGTFVRPVVFTALLRSVVSTTLLTSLTAIFLITSPAGPATAQQNPPSPAEAQSSSNEDALLDDLEDDYAADEAAVVDVPDPQEPLNRAVFGFNLFLDTTILKPVAYTYRTVTPKPVRTGITNAVNNTYAPVTIFNAVLQGNRQKAGDTTVRFLLNTTLGFGGLLDVATMAGLPQHYEDFGQTLATYGVPSGDYMVVPILGPMTPRHLTGRAVDYLTNPLTWLLWDASAVSSTAPTVANLVIERELNIESVDAMQASPDFYQVAKSAYVQNRQAAINDTEVSDHQIINAGVTIKPVSFRLDEATKENELGR